MDRDAVLDNILNATHILSQQVRRTAEALNIQVYIVFVKSDRVRCVHIEYVVCTFRLCDRCDSFDFFNLGGTTHHYAAFLFLYTDCHDMGGMHFLYNEKCQN